MLELIYSCLLYVEDDQTQNDGSLNNHARGECVTTQM